MASARRKAGSHTASHGLSCPGPGAPAPSSVGSGGWASPAGPMEVEPASGAQGHASRSDGAQAVGRARRPGLGWAEARSAEGAALARREGKRLSSTAAGLPKTGCLSVCCEDPGLTPQGHGPLGPLPRSELQTLPLTLLSDSGGSALALNLTVQKRESQMLSNTVVLFFYEEERQVESRAPTGSGEAGTVARPDAPTAGRPTSPLPRRLALPVRLT